MSKGERERSHQSLSSGRKREKVLRGRKRSPGGENTQGSQMLDVQEERCHMYFSGKTCLYMLICIKLYSFISFSSDLLFPIFSQYPMSDSGGARHLRERNHSNSLHI